MRHAIAVALAKLDSLAAGNQADWYANRMALDEWLGRKTWLDARCRALGCRVRWASPLAPTGAVL